MSDDDYEYSVSYYPSGLTQMCNKYVGKDLADARFFAAGLASDEQSEVLLYRVAPGDREAEIVERFNP